MRQYEKKNKKTQVLIYIISWDKNFFFFKIHLIQFRFDLLSY